MMEPIKLPETYRPRTDRYRKLCLGLDIPSQFWYDLRAIDHNLHLIYHPYRIMWDNIVNSYSGSLEDPRHVIHVEYGELNFGFVPTDRTGRPIPENSWHVWRLNSDHGWAHIVKIESVEPEYMNLLLRRLYAYRCWINKYGFSPSSTRKYHQMLEQMREEDRERMRQEKDYLFQTAQEENKWLVRRAAEEFARGNVAPTNPQKETIMSFSNQKNKSRIIRPLEDEEGGLVVPETY